MKLFNTVVVLLFIIALTYTLGCIKLASDCRDSGGEPVQTIGEITCTKKQ